jgi:hypothetical protein
MRNFVNRESIIETGCSFKRNGERIPITRYWHGMARYPAGCFGIMKRAKQNFFVYDLVNRNKLWKHEIKAFDQVQDMKFMLDANTLLMSAVRSGQTDIYVYKIDKQTFEQVTNDAYDDLDPSFVAFPNKTGILYSSNRPSAEAATSDDSLPGKHYNIYLVDNWNKSEFKQISKLSDLQTWQCEISFTVQSIPFHFCKR